MVTILAMITQAMATDLERCYPHEMFQEAFCGTVSVPEDHGNPAGKRLELSIQVIPSIRANAKDDPVFVFAGGPGQGAVEVSPMMMPFAVSFAGFQLHRRSNSNQSVPLQYHPLHPKS